MPRAAPLTRAAVIPTVCVRVAYASVGTCIMRRRDYVVSIDVFSYSLHWCIIAGLIRKSVLRIVT